MVVETSADRCRRYRRRILEVSRQVEAAHVASAFSCLEVVDCLYHDVLRPQDIFIMSKGHGCLAQYVILEDLGTLPRESLDHFCKHVPDQGPDNFPQLGSHPDYDPGIGIHASTGSLGHGLGIAAGQALAEKLKKKSDARVYVLLSDGECQSGSTWEAAMVAANLRLDNLALLVDFNGWGGMDPTDWFSGRFPALTPLADKFAAFGCDARNFNGHNPTILGEMVRWLGRDDRPKRPLAAVCHTVKGCGVSFIQDGLPGWHYRSPTEEEHRSALVELGEGPEE